MLIPIFIIAFYLPGKYSNLIATFIFLLAAFTDLLDGYLARVLGQVSRFGAFLDPVADKLMVAVTLVLLVSQAYLPYIAVPAAIIVGREIAISALREWMAEVGKRASVAVSMVGKVKTVVQMVALISLLLYHPAAPKIFFVVGYILLYASAILTLWSMIMYIRAAWPNLINSIE
jgi:CDP-diacylglycerol--glycerol-3-phosphate 3-phosphatidyltransferase